jgi:phenylacetate-CoA ligase
MNGLSIYEHLPVTLQNRIVAHYGERLHRMRFGGLHQEQYGEILRCEDMSSGELSSFVCEKLRTVLRDAADYVPYYQPISDMMRSMAESMREPSEVADLPQLEKAAVNREPESLCSVRPMGKRIRGHTSGTTGRPIRTVKLAESYQRNWAFFRRAKEMHGIRLGMRRASFGTRAVVPVRQQKLPFWRYEPAEHNVYFSLFHLSRQNLDSYYRKLVEWNPEEIVAYPSALAVIAGYMLEKGLTLPGRRVAFMQAETLFGWQRERIEKAMSARVVNLYGLAENVAWINECPWGRLHIRPDYGYVELLPVSGKRGDDRGREVREIVATGLINPAMPLIRYRTGDQVLLTANDRLPCACGLPFPTVTEVIGRTDDNLITSDGRVQTRLDGIFKGVAGVRESQIEQLAIDRFTVRIIPSPEGPPPGLGEIATRLKRIFGASADFEMRFVDQLPMNRAGKVRYQINSMPKEDRARLGMEIGTLR